MNFTVSAHNAQHYLLVVGSGTAGYADLRAACSFGAELAKNRGTGYVLFDMLAVESGLTSQERHDLARHYSKAFKGIEALALVLPPEQRSGIGELVAAQEGLNLNVFSYVEGALNWIEAFRRG